MLNTNQFMSFCKKAKKVMGKTYLPILDCCLIRGGAISVTNLEITLTEKIEGLEDMPDFCMDFKDFAALIDKLKNQDFQIEVGSDSVIEILTAKGKFNFTGQDPLGFPTLPGEFDLSEFAILTKGDIPKLRKAVAYASNDESRPVMNAVFVGDKIVASDMHRLCFYPREAPSKPFLLPSKAIPLLDDQAYECFERYEDFKDYDWVGGVKTEKLTRSLKHIKLVSGNTEIIYHIVEGGYPDYRQVIPESFNSFLEIPAKQLSETLDLCALTMGKGNTLIKFSSDTVSEELTISCQVIDLGKAYSNTVPAKNSGDGIEIRFNIEFLKSVIATEKMDTVKFKFVGPSNPCIINDEVLLMPVMLKA